MRHVSMTVMMMILLAGGATIEGVGDKISNRGPNRITLSLPADWVDNLRGLQGSYVLCGGTEGALTLKTLLREGGVTFVEKRALGKGQLRFKRHKFVPNPHPPTLITLFTHESLSNLSCVVIGDNVIDCTSPLHLAWDERQSRGDSGGDSWQEEEDNKDRVEEDRRERRHNDRTGYYGGARTGARTGLGEEEAANYAEAVDVATLIVSILTGLITSLVGWTVRQCMTGGGCGCFGRGSLRLMLPRVRPTKRRYSSGASLYQDRGQMAPRGVRGTGDEQQEYIEAGQGGNVEGIERVEDPEQPPLAVVSNDNYGRYVLVPKRRCRRQ